MTDNKTTQSRLSGFRAKTPSGQTRWFISKQARDAYTAMLSKLSKVPEK
jgi:hypothetical protein|tara:strand:+ start:259 stop:405 length:147 start_codon:yes stop_codon:yes gene_type:complete